VRGDGGLSIIDIARAYRRKGRRGPTSIASVCRGSGDRLRKGRPSRQTLIAFAIERDTEMEWQVERGRRDSRSHAKKTTRRSGKGDPVSKGASGA
jgi:hypothetical protein